MFPNERTPEADHIPALEGSRSTRTRSVGEDCYGRTPSQHDPLYVLHTWELLSCDVSNGAGPGDYVGGLGRKVKHEVDAVLHRPNDLFISRCLSCCKMPTGSPES